MVNRGELLRYVLLTFIVVLAITFAARVDSLSGHAIFGFEQAEEVVGFNEPGIGVEILAFEESLPEVLLPTENPSSETIPFEEFEGENGGPSPSSSGSPLDLPYWIDYSEWPYPCDPANPPLGKSELCPVNALGTWKQPIGIQDMKEMIKSTQQWGNASNYTGVFSIPEPVLREYLKYGDATLHAGLARIINQGYIGISTPFLQANKTSFEFNGTAGQCCVHPYSTEFTHWGQRFTTFEVYQDLKQFMQSRSLPLDRLVVFINTYDAIADSPVKKPDAIPPKTYAREVVRHVAAIRNIFPDAYIVIQELAANQTGSIEEQRIHSFVKELGNETLRTGTIIDGILVDSVKSDPRAISEPCRIGDQQNGTIASNGVPALKRLIPVVNGAGFNLGARIEPFTAKHPVGTSCQFPKDNWDAYQSYMESLYKLIHAEALPDFFVLTSETPFPSKATNESNRSSIARAILDYYLTHQKLRVPAHIHEEGWGKPKLLGFNDNGWEDSAYITRDGNQILLYHHPWPELATNESRLRATTIAATKPKEAKEKGIDGKIYVSDKPFITERIHPISQNKTYAHSQACPYLSKKGDLYYCSTKESWVRGNGTRPTAYKNGVRLDFGTPGEEGNPHYCAARDEMWFGCPPDQHICVMKNARTTNYTGPVTRAPYPINNNKTGAHDFQPFLTDDCETVYFTSNRGSEPLGVYRAKRLDGTGDTWSTPELFISHPAGTAEVSITEEGNEMIWAQLFWRENGLPGIDIYYSKKVDSSAGPISPSIVPSRTSGVAPLLVHFDATDTVASTTTKPFHELHYEWNFGDSQTQTWTTSGTSKNTARGPLSAHVFEQPGTYTVRLEVKDLAGNKETQNVTITVEDPNVIFSGTKTICVSTGSDFSGCPSGAQQMTTSRFSDLQRHLKSDVRILLRRGDTWRGPFTDHTVTIPAFATRGIIGAFGTCRNPSARGICENAPVIENTLIGRNSFRIITVDETRDWRIMDLLFKGIACESDDTQSCGGAIGGITDIQNLLHLRVKAEGFSVPLGTSLWCDRSPNCRAHHNLYGIVDSSISDGYVNQLYTGSERFVLLGNHFSDSLDSHVVRVWQSYKGVMGHNNLSGSSLDTLQGRHALKFHSQDLRNNPFKIQSSTFNIISNNIFGTSGPWPVAIGPQGGPYDERVSELIFEKNHVLANFGRASRTLPQLGVILWAQNATFRNNIFDATGATSYYSAIKVEQRVVEPPPKNIVVDNNLLYRGDTSTGTLSFLEVDDATNPVIARNNILFAPRSNTRFWIGAGPVQATNNLEQDPSWNNPAGRDFTLKKGSKAIDFGIKVPVFDDILQNLREEPYDAGPHEFTSAFSLGINPDAVNDYSGQHVFVDTFKQSREWIPGDSSKWEHECIKREKLIPVDSNGWVTHVPFDPPRCTQWDCTGQRCIRCSGASCPDHGPQIVRTKLLPNKHAIPGDYTLRFDGSGTIDFAGKRFTQAGTNHKITVNGGDLTLNILRSERSNPIRNIRLIMPGHETTYQTKPFYQPFITRLNGQKVLRFMDMMETNNQELSNWNDRTTTTYVTQSGEHGVALEHLIDIANAAGIDPWFTLPHKANNTFFKEFATIVKNRLDPSLTVYIEWSNEVWNNQFAQASYAETQGWNLRLASTPFESRLKYQARMSAELFHEFEQVFGPEKDRVINVVSGQAANSWIGQTILEGINDSKINLHYNDGVRAEALAIAPYFGTSIADDIVRNGEVNTITIQEILNRLDADIDASTAVWTKSNYNVANRFGIPLVAYEGGQHLAGTAGNENIQALTDKLVATNRHPQMEPLYDKMFKVWSDNGGELFAVFNFVSSYSKWGSWGVLEWIDQPTATAPKWRSVLKHLGSTRQCTPNTQQFCNVTNPRKDFGVCKGARQTCTAIGRWPGCGTDEYNHTGNYELTETTCDGLDNDCDGEIDEGCNPTFNFNLVANPSSGSAVQGGYNETTITLTKTTTGSSGTVTLKALNNPSNITTTFYPSSCNFDNKKTSCTSRLRIDVGPQAKTGINTINIEGTSGTTKKQTKYDLDVKKKTLPGTPIITSIEPNRISNRIDTDISIKGENFTELAGLLIGTILLPIDKTIPINETLIRYLATKGLTTGTYPIKVINLDLKESNTVNLLIEDTTATQKILDTDLDGIPNQKDKCPRTPSKLHQRTKGGRSGCPTPNYGKFNKTITTNFTNITNPHQIPNFKIGIINKGQITFKENISITKLNANYFRFEQINLEQNIDIEKNKARLDEQNIPTLNVKSEIEFYNTTITNPVLTRNKKVCNDCKIIDYNTKTTNTKIEVQGWSEYEITQGTCGDKYCSITETKNNCPNDCGKTGGSGGGGGGGSGGGGGGGSPSNTIKINLDDNKTHTKTIKEGTKIDLTLNGKVYRLEITKTENNTATIHFKNISKILTATTLELYTIDITLDNKKDIELYTTKTGTTHEITIKKIQEQKQNREENKKNNTQGDKKPTTKETQKISRWILLLLAIPLITAIIFFIILAIRKKRIFN